jgi:hypothetical protein
LTSYHSVDNGLSIVGSRFKSYWGDKAEVKNLRVTITKRNDMAMKLAYNVINIRGKGGDLPMKKLLDI